jgi:hypothetical protein
MKLQNIQKHFPHSSQQPFGFAASLPLSRGENESNIGKPSTRARAVELRGFDDSALLITINMTEIQSSYGRQGLEAQTSTPEQFAAFIGSPLEQHAKLIKAIGLKPE